MKGILKKLFKKKQPKEETSSIKFISYHTKIVLPIYVEFDLSGDYKNCFEKIVWQLEDYYKWCKNGNNDKFAEEYKKFIANTKWLNSELYEFLMKCAKHYGWEVLSIK